MKRLRAFSFVATLVVAATLGTSIINAKVPDVYISYQTGGHTCWDASSPTEVAKGNYDWRSSAILTKSADDANAFGFFGTGWGDWATNRDGSPVNCLKVNLFPSQTKLTTKEFVLCGQAAEVRTTRSFFQSIFGGQSSIIEHIGSEVCSDTISVTSGNFLKLSTSQNGIIGAVRFRFKPAGFFGGLDNVERDLRVSTQLQSTTGTKGGIVSTAWSRAGFQDANVNQAGGNLNGIYFALETKTGGTTTSSCTAEQASHLPAVDLTDITYVTTNKSGITTCPAGRLFVGVDQQDHAGAIRIKCATARNILRDIGQTEVAFTGEATYKCQAGSIVVGIVQDSAGREKAIRCQEVAQGAIDFANGDKVVGVHGRAGDRYEVNFNENKIGSWLPTAGIYNAAPSDSRGLKGYLVGPVAPMSCTPPTTCTQTQPVPASEQPTVDLTDITYVATQASATTVCPDDRVFVGVDQQDHAGAVKIKCAKARNVLDPNNSYAEIPMSTENTFRCPGGFMIVGLKQDSAGRENAIRCKRLVVGAANLTSPLSVVGVHGRAGDRYEVNFNENKTGQWIPIEAIFNADPSSSRGVKGYNVAPITQLPSRTITVPCDTPNPPTNPPTGNEPGGNGTTPPGGNGNGDGGNGTVVPPAACTFSASKTTIIKGVDTSTLSWSCTNGAATATISGLGSVSKSGTRVVSPTEDTTYTLTYGTVTQSITIKVNTPNIQEQ